ncbi:DcuS/MalK family sensor histidine kinase [Staphylococcus succinus]
MRKRQLKLSTIIIIFVCLVVILSLVITSLLIGNTVRNAIHKTAEEKAEVISRTIAHSEIVESGFKHQKNAYKIQSYTSEIQSVTGVSFIVVMDMHGIRKSHPNPDLIGKRFQGGDEMLALNGKSSMSEAKGTLGKSLRSFTPVYDNNHKQIGVVAVGVPMKSVDDAMSEGKREVLIGTLLGILVGILGAYLLSRYIKRILYGLEPSAIAKLLEERNTMLQSVHEGIVAVDQEGKINLVNKSAKEIFKKAGLPDRAVGMKIDDYMQSTQLPHVLAFGKPELDEEQNINGIKILVNRVPLFVNNEIVGAISTFRDKTEMAQLSEQLVGVKTYAETLRAQSHEFSNRLHVILGLIQMENYKDLEKYIHEIVDHGTQENETIASNIKDPALAGFLIGKLSLAREKDIELSIINENVIREPEYAYLTHETITIIGNLIDNSMDALSSSSSIYPTIEVYLKYLDKQLYIDVMDSGIGLNDELQQKIFDKGYSTKGNHRGYGLYLVKQSVEKLEGTITIDTHVKGKTQFSVVIPYEEKGNHQ